MYILFVISPYFHKNLLKKFLAISLKLIQEFQGSENIAEPSLDSNLFQ